MGTIWPQTRFPNASTAPARFYVASGFIIVPRRLQTCVKMLPKCHNHGQQHVLWAAASVMLTGSSDHVHWTAPDPSKHDLTLPQTIGLANCGQYISIYIYIYTAVYVCILSNKCIYPRCFRVEGVLRPMGSQAPPITYSGRFETQADMI